MMRVRVNNVSRPRFTSMGFLRVSAFLAEVHRNHMSGEKLGAKTHGLLAHVLDELRSLDAVWKSREILHQRGNSKLSAGLMAIDDERAKIGAGSIDCGGQSRTSGTDDDDVTHIVWHRTGVRFRFAPEDATAPVVSAPTTNNGLLLRSLNGQTAVLRILTSACGLRNV